MHPSHYILIANPNVLIARCAYNEDKPGINTDVTAFKTLDTSIQPGDYVVIPTNRRHGMTVVRVKSVDPLLKSRYAIKGDDKLDWIIGKVDKSAYETLLKHEGDLIERFNALEIERERQELAKTHMAGAGEIGISFADNPLVKIAAPKAEDLPATAARGVD